MTDVEHITPYGSEGDNRNKSAQVRDMFDNIAPAYDRMNRLMSLGLDKRWRKKCINAVTACHPERVLDLATGTGDLAIALADALSDSHITGADLSSGMIAIAKLKAEQTGNSERIHFQIADALAMPFENDTFDVITIAFGVRNFEHLSQGFGEMLRVLRPGGKLIVLELTPPASKIVKPFYNLYTRGIIPLAGQLMSGDSRAYKYLPESIAAVPARDNMTRLMTEAGFCDCRWENLTMGVATMYSARKNNI